MKLKAIFATAAAGAFLFSSCQQAFEPTYLDQIRINPSYVGLPMEGGEVKVVLSAADAWHLDESTLNTVDVEVSDPQNPDATITEKRPWLTVSPMSGDAGSEIEITLSADNAALDRADTIQFVCGNVAQYLIVKQPGDPSLAPQYPEVESGEYWFMINKGTADEPEWDAIQPVAPGNSYGYLNSQPAVVGDDGTPTSTAGNVFTLTAVNGGFTIQDANGRYYYMTGTYDSCNVSDDLPESGSVWTVSQTGDFEYTVTNASNGKIMQYDPEYSSMGAYSAADRGIRPYLVKAEAPAPDLIKIDKTEWELNKPAGTLQVPAEGTTFVVGVDFDADWLDYRGVEYVEGSSCLVFDYTENTGTETRTVTVSVLASDGTNESSAELKISQLAASLPEGLAEKGTADDPYSVASANAIFDAGAWVLFGDGKESAYFKGIVSSIKEISPSYGNATYYISADGTETADQLYIFRGKYFGDENFTSEDQLKVGDEVVICGHMDVYNTTEEITDSYIYSINGKIEAE